MDNSFYYLHIDGDLIHKYGEPDDEVYDSDFVKYVWTFDGINIDTDRICAWRIIVESLALGANTKRVLELACKWNCDINDLPEYMVREASDDNEVNALRRVGLNLFIELLGYNADETIKHISATPFGKNPDMSKLTKVVH